MTRLFWLSDEAWAAIDPHLPRGKPGKPRVDDRRVISGILHVLKTGCRWRDVPPEYGPATTIYNRYNRWSQRGLWQRLFEPHQGCHSIYLQREQFLTRSIALSIDVATLSSASSAVSRTGDALQQGTTASPETISPHSLSSPPSPSGSE